MAWLSDIEIAQNCVMRPISDIAEKSRRYTELKEIIDEKEFRWLELSEKM